MSVLYDWYNLNVSEKITHKENYYINTTKMLAEYDYLKNKMSKKDGVHFDIMIQRLNDMENISGYEKFELGFQQGVMLMSEIFKDDGQNSSLLYQLLKLNKKD